MDYILRAVLFGHISLITCVRWGSLPHDTTMMYGCADERSRTDMIISVPMLQLPDCRKRPCSLEIVDICGLFTQVHRSNLRDG